APLRFIEHLPLLGVRGDTLRGGTETLGEVLDRLVEGRAERAARLERVLVVDLPELVVEEEEVALRPAPEGERRHALAVLVRVLALQWRVVDAGRYITELDPAPTQDTLLDAKLLVHLVELRAGLGAAQERQHLFLDHAIVQAGDRFQGHAPPQALRRQGDGLRQRARPALRLARIFLGK